MRGLREDTFSGNKDEDAHDHIDRVLSIVGLFNIPGVSKDAVMLQVFPFTLTGSAKRWVDRLAQELSIPGISSKRPLSKGTIPEMRPAQAVTAIQTMDDHSQKWHDGTTSRNTKSSSSKDGLAALVNKLDNLGRDIKKIKESVHAIQVGRQICEGPHLDKDCPLNEEVKQVEEVRYEEFRRTTPFNGNNGGKFHVGPPGYYTKIDNRPPYGEKRQSLEELLAKHQEESAQRSTKIEGWIKKLQENAETNTRNQSASLKNLETQIEQLTKEIHCDKILNSSSEQIKTVTSDQETSGLNKLHGVSFIYGPETNTPEDLQHQRPPKELNPGSFTLPCTIGKFNFYAMADLDNSAFVNNPTHRSFDDYKSEFNLEIDKLADEYEFGIGKKGHILNNIWEYCNQLHNKNNEWHNYEFENEECEEIGIKDKDYHSPEVQVDTFEVKKYSFEGGQSFICVTKDLDNTLPLGRKNGSKFKEMIRKNYGRSRRRYSHHGTILSIVTRKPGTGRVSKDAVMLRVFPFTLTGSAKRWVDRLAPGTINTWDLLKKAFIQRYCPPSMTAKQLEDIHNFKQEGDESLYQAWERYNDLLYKCPTHDINNHQKVNIFYKGLSTMNRQLLDSQGPIPGMRPAQALTAIQTMADHSQKMA
ncbi:zinc knuckle CX2CX4HX4C containing protein [Tanacetum coccineum]